MLAYLKYQKELGLLQKEMANLEKEYVKIESSYFNKNDNGHLSYLAFKRDEFSMRIEYYKTLYFKSEANSLLIPMPPENDINMYITYVFDGDSRPVKILTTNGIHYLRSKLTDEKKLNER